MAAKTTQLLLPNELQDAGSELAATDRDALRAVSVWISDFVARPHKDLGRAGAICPFVPGSLERRTLWLAAEHVADLGVADVVALMDGYKRHFLQIAPAGSDDAIYKTIYAVYLTHLPVRRTVDDAALGAAKQTVTLRTADGVRLRGWYVPSRNGAAVAVMHGTGSNRLGVAGHARVLIRHGYGVLLFDLQGHGASEGRSTSLPSRMQQDADAALAYLQQRPDVRAGRIGVLGVSLGGEVAVHAAARRSEWRAVVLEGVQGASPADMRASRPDPATFAVLTALYGLGRVLGGSMPAASNPEEIERISPRPLLLLSAGRSTEARANEEYKRRGGSTTELWNMPDARHAAALRTAPAEYERRVIDFLTRTLN